MELKLDESKLSKSNMSPPEILLLKVLHEHNCLSDILETLKTAGFVDMFDCITNTGEMILNRILEEKSEAEEYDEDEKRLTEIAKALINLYPTGFKKMLVNGNVIDSPYPWRGSVRLIRDRIEKFERFYYEGQKLSLEDAIEATQRYIDKQKKNDEYPYILTYMKTLKYFIYKKEESDLLNYLETEEGEDVYRFDESNGMTIL